MTPTEPTSDFVVGKFPQINSRLVLTLSESFDDSCIRQLDISGRVSDGKLTLSSAEPFPNCKKIISKIFSIQKSWSSHEKSLDFFFENDAPRRSQNSFFGNGI